MSLLLTDQEERFLAHRAKVIDEIAGNGFFQYDFDDADDRFGIFLTLRFRPVKTSPTMTEEITVYTLPNQLKISVHVAYEYHS